MNRRIILRKTAAILVFALLAATQAAHSNGSASKDSIQSCIRQFNYSEALNLLNSALQVEPKNKELLSTKGYVLKELYSYDLAIKAYADAFAQDTTDLRLLISLANTYKLAHDYPNAVRCFANARTLDSANKYLQLEVATCKLLNNQYREANFDFFRLLKQDSLNTYVLKSLAYSFNQIESYDWSIRYFQKSLNIQPNDPGCVISLANLFLKQKQYRDGIQVTENYRALDSTNLDVNAKNAYFYLLDKKYPQAIARFQRCLAAGDSSKFVFKNIGIAYYSINEYDTAKTFLEEAYSQDPEDAGTLHFLGICCYRSFYKELGIRYLEEALKLYQPTEEKIALVYQNYAEACRGWDKCPGEKKIASTLRAYELNPTDSTLALNLAREYERLKNYPKALQYHEQYLATLKSDTNDPSQRDYRKRYEWELDQLRKKLLVPAAK